MGESVRNTYEFNGEKKLWPEINLNSTGGALFLDVFANLVFKSRYLKPAAYQHSAVDIRPIYVYMSAF